MNLLKRSHLFALGFCFILLLILWAPRLFLLVDSHSIDAYQQISKQIVWPNQLFCTIPFTWIAFSLTFISASLLLFLNNRHLFHTSNEFLLPLIYILIASAIPSTQWFSGVQVAVLVILTGLNYLFFSHHRYPGLAELFIAGFCFSLASLCFPPAFFLLLFFPVAMLVLRPFTWSDCVVALASISAPYSYLLLYYWLTTNDTMQAIEIFNYILPDLPQQIPSINTSQAVFFCVIGGLILISLIGLFVQKAGAKMKTAHIRVVFTWMLFFLIAAYAFYPAYNYQVMPLIALPATVVMANYFSQSKGRKIKIFCWLILIAAIIYLQVVEFL